MIASTVHWPQHRLAFSSTTPLAWEHLHSAQPKQPYMAAHKRDHVPFHHGRLFLPMQMKELNLCSREEGALSFLCAMKPVIFHFVTESFGALIFCPCMLFVSDWKSAHKWGQDPQSQVFGKCCLLAYLHFCKSCLKIQIYQLRQVSNFFNPKSKKSRSMKSQGPDTLAAPSLVTVSYKMNGSIFRVTHSDQWPLTAPGLSSPKDKSTESSSFSSLNTLKSQTWWSLAQCRSCAHNSANHIDQGNGVC